MVRVISKPVLLVHLDVADCNCKPMDRTSFFFVLCSTPQIIRMNLSDVTKHVENHSDMINYGSINLRRTHRTTAYTSEGISETCNTEYLPVSESGEVTRFFLLQNQVQ